MILLTPGPCMTSETVRQAGAQPDLNHRDPHYRLVVREVKEILSEASGGFHPYLLGGSGTAAMEAAVTSCIGDKPSLILSDGYYSERMEDLFEVHGLPHMTLSFDWLTGWDLAKVEEAIQNQEWGWVVMTHHETTTGRLNPVETVAKMAKAAGAKVMVDAMSSFGADPLDFTDLDVVVSSANKCLHGLPGVSFVLTRDIVDTETPRSFYLHLPRYQGDSPPLTPPVPAMLSFWQALREWQYAGGRPAREVRYRQLTDLMRGELTAKGLNIGIPREQSSSTMVLSSLPAGTSYEGFFDYCYQQGYVLYRSKKHLADDWFIASVMGEVTEQQVKNWLQKVPTAPSA